MTCHSLIMHAKVHSYKLANRTRKLYALAYTYTNVLMQTMMHTDIEGMSSAYTRAILTHGSEL